VNDLLDFVIERHGGIDRWYEASTVSTTVHVHEARFGSTREQNRLPF